MQLPSRQASDQVLDDPNRMERWGTGAVSRWRRAFKFVVEKPRRAASAASASSMTVFEELGRLAFEGEVGSEGATDSSPGKLPADLTRRSYGPEQTA